MLFCIYAPKIRSRPASSGKLWRYVRYADTLTAATTTAFTTFSSGDRLVPKWSDWSPFSECSATCGGGTKTKTRLCSVENACPGVDTKMGFILLSGH